MKRLVVILLALLVCHNAGAQLIAHRGVAPGAYDFWVSVPQCAEDSVPSKLPAIIFLHGRSLCGNNLDKVRTYGVLDALRYSLDVPAIVIAPQNPGKPWDPQGIMTVLEWVEAHYPVDPERVSVAGMSLGGYGTIDFAATYPDKVAAAFALCGGGTVNDFSGLAKVPLWIMHGYADVNVNWTESQKVVDGIVAAGDTTRLRYDLFPGVDHGRLARCFYLQKTYDWLLNHSLSDSLRAVDRKDSISVKDMANAYGNFNRPRTDLVVRDYDGTGLRL